MNRVIRLLPDVALFATLLFVVGIYFELDFLDDLFKGADITIIAFLTLVLTWLKNAKGMHKDAISILESDNKHLQREVHRLEKDLTKLTRAAGETSIEKAESKIRTLSSKSEGARVNANWRHDLFAAMLQEFDTLDKETIKKRINVIISKYP